MDGDIHVRCMTLGYWLAKGVSYLYVSGDDKLVDKEHPLFGGDRTKYVKIRR